MKPIGFKHRDLVRQAEKAQKSVEAGLKTMTKVQGLIEANAEMGRKSFENIESAIDMDEEMKVDSDDH